MTAEPKPTPELIGFTCVCGIAFYVDLRQGPAKFTAECPDECCRRIYQVDYVGRRLPKRTVPFVLPSGIPHRQ